MKPTEKTIPQYSSILAKPKKIPTATYRVQFNSVFTFCQAKEIVNYLHELGVSDIYASPFLKARQGSLHGYDVTNHSEINPEVGTEQTFETFTNELNFKGMGMILDVVPNHMCITDASNLWWMDVLENGPSSIYADFFDINWNPPKKDLHNKILLPFLGDQYGHVLENGQIKIVYESGVFWTLYGSQKLPVAPKTWMKILNPVLEYLKKLVDEQDPHKLELESIITALHNLPERIETDPEKVKERQREKEVIKRRLDQLAKDTQKVQEAIDQSLISLNGNEGHPRTFDQLEELIEEQIYRLCYWRVAADEINYRRFFDINELAAIRMEKHEVFKEANAKIFEYMSKDWFTGLRIDHVDGLYDPDQYLADLQNAYNIKSGNGRDHSCYVVVEKILCRNEKVRPNWAVQGTVGYEALNQLNHLFVEHSHRNLFNKLYSRFTGSSTHFSDMVIGCKKLILLVSMSSELYALAVELDQISEQHRWSRDFTKESIRFTLREVIATLGVYRTYLRSDQEKPEHRDVTIVRQAVLEAKYRNPATSGSLFDFIESVLLLEHPLGLEDAQRAQRRQFVMKFQQITGAVMAKGVEDTAFYRYFPLASLNEVGGEPDQFGISTDEFHQINLERKNVNPFSLLATSTHDTKRSEDVRARLNVLSEIPQNWVDAISSWYLANFDSKKTVDDKEAPTRNDEYLIYQTLVGTWPLESLTEENRTVYVERIQNYILKAMREAKLRSSWINPNQNYENAVLSFIENILSLSEKNIFLESFKEFIKLIEIGGMINSLSQVVLKATSPGIPDFYQGTELWDLSLVDPDNRRPVDYQKRMRMLKEISSNGDVGKMFENWKDGRIKLHVTRALLKHRGSHRDLFENGNYLPIKTDKKAKVPLVAFGRVYEGKHVIVIVPIRAVELAQAYEGRQMIQSVWGDLSLNLPESMKHKKYRNVLTNEVIESVSSKRASHLSLSQTFKTLPIAVLIGE